MESVAQKIEKNARNMNTGEEPKKSHSSVHTPSVNDIDTQIVATTDETVHMWNQRRVGTDTDTHRICDVRVGAVFDQSIDVGRPAILCRIS